MNLEDWMTLARVNDAELARRLGGKVTRSQISRIRRRKCRPSFETATNLEAVTKIPAGTLMAVEVER
jgi:transcriptional regulator with XRE-family HTH domain